MRRLLLVAALAATPLAVQPATAATTCVRTPGSLYWEVCVVRGGCAVYVWSTMPPAICV